jgi:hypothetical protein
LGTKSGVDTFYLRRKNKIAAIVFFVAYACLSIGMTVTTHLCGDEVASVNLLPFAPSDACGCGDTAVPDDCCKTELHAYQVSDEQLAVQQQHFASPQTDDILWLAEHITEIPSSCVQTVYLSSSPPESPPKTILYCTLLI